MRLRRTVPLGALVASLTMVLASAANNQTARASTTVPGLMPTLVAGTQDLGLTRTSSHDVMLTLPLRNQGELSRLVAAQRDPSSSDYRRFLSPQEFNRRFAPTPASVNEVAAWARSHGLSVVSVTGTRTLLRIRGSTQAMGAAFGITLHDYRNPAGVDFVAPTSRVAVPALLEGRIDAVIGLSNLGRSGSNPLRKNRRRNGGSSGQPAQAAAATPLGPNDLMSIYNAPADQTGAGQTLAVIAAGDVTQTERDLRTFEQHYNLPQVPWTTVTVNGGSSDTSGAPEWALDTQYATAFAPNASRMMVYDAPSLSDADIAAAVARWVSDDAAPQASFSAGECEFFAQMSGLQTALDQTLEQAVAQGQTLFVASGDTGSFCPIGSYDGIPLGLAGVNYPAASPFAVAVGGTSLSGRGSSATETGWSGSGGGTAAFESTPAYQDGIATGTLAGARGVPDVSLDADPHSGYTVVVGGQPMLVGGTSASAPSWQGIWARAQSAHGGRLGFANPVLYRLSSRCFRDITTGNNGGYVATRGWDAVTGLGTPDISAVVTDA